MSIGSDPIECCVRGRFLCVCVTARRRGFRGAFCVGAPRNFFRPVSRAFPASVSRRGGIGAGFLFPLRCAFRLVPALRRPAFSRSRTMAGLRSFRTSAGGRAALFPLFTLRRQGSLQEVFSFRQASDESADRIRRVENALHVAALSGRAAAFGGTRGRRGRTVSLDTGEIMSDEREGADAGKRAGARSGPCPQAVVADESPGLGNSAMGGKVKRRRRKPPAFRKKVTPIGLKPITF